jgi:hypothetical protein
MRWLFFIDKYCKVRASIFTYVATDAFFFIGYMCFEIISHDEYILGAEIHAQSTTFAPFFVNTYTESFFHNNLDEMVRRHIYFI